VCSPFEAGRNEPDPPCTRGSHRDVFVSCWHSVWDVSPSFPGPHKHKRLLVKSDERSERTTAKTWLATARSLAVDVQEGRFPADPAHMHPEARQRVRLIQDVR
jgi:hypothetical protein